MADHPINVEYSDEVSFSYKSILPHEKIFSIQVGHRLFRLSGLSLSSDAPSYFTRFFNKPENKDKVLFIDRNPDIFEQIYNHLQGYPINVKCDYQFVHLWSDVFYFDLRNLQKFLVSEDIFATVGNKTFKVSKSLFTHTGNYPNYFTVVYEQLFNENMAAMEQKGMLRPPPVRPATVNLRSPQLFEELLEMLRGNTSVIRNDEHRSSLIRECKYYRFSELEQRIVKHRIVNNPYAKTHTQEIIINVNDLHKKGVVNKSPMDKLTEVPLMYQRPYIKDEPVRCLVFQIDSAHGTSDVRLVLNRTINFASVVITNAMCKRFKHVFSEFAKEFPTDTAGGMTMYRFSVGFSGSKSVINGKEMKETWVQNILSKDDEEGESAAKRTKREDVKGDIIEFKLTKSLWRMVMRGNLARLHAVSLEGYTDAKEYLQRHMEFL